MLNLLFLPVALVLSRPRVGHAINEFMAATLEATATRCETVNPDRTAGLLDGLALRNAASVIRRNKDLGRSA